MNNTLEYWIVERINTDGQVIYTQSFPNKDEALEVYKSLREETTDPISLYKSQKKLLQEG